MKILQITPRYSPQSGGVETHVQQISERLVARGHTVTVLTADASLDGENRERRNGVRIQRYRSLGKKESIHFCPQIGLAVRNADVDVVHAHNYHSLPVFFTALAVADQRFILTTHYHGESADQTRDRLLSLYHPFGQWAVRKANHVVAVSNWEREQLELDFNIEPSVIPNGVDVDRFAKAEPEIRAQPYLLCVGRLEKYKGVQHLIQALPKLPTFELVVAGKGPYRDNLERIATEVGVSNRVTFLGYVDNGRLPELYAGAAVYITLSLFEAYGMTVGEALAAGTPCVVREAGALSEWTKNRGCVGVDDITSRTITDAVNTVVNREVTTTLPKWSEVTDQILYCYER